MHGTLTWPSLDPGLWGLILEGRWPSGTTEGSGGYGEPGCLSQLDTRSPHSSPAKQEVWVHFELTQHVFSFQELDSYKEERKAPSIIQDRMHLFYENTTKKNTFLNVINWNKSVHWNIIYSHCHPANPTWKIECYVLVPVVWDERRTRWGSPSGGQSSVSWHTIPHASLSALGGGCSSLLTSGSPSTGMLALQTDTMTKKNKNKTLMWCQMQQEWNK